MKYLEKYDFTKDEVASFVANIPAAMSDMMKLKKKLICNNLDYLKGIGVSNYKDVFLNYYEMFLLDDSVFRGIFDKYDHDDLVDKIAKNINIVEYL